MDLVVRRDVLRVAALETRDRLLERESRWDFIIASRSASGHWLGLASCRNTAMSCALAYQRSRRLVGCRGVASLGRGEQVGGGEDVVAQQRGELRPAARRSRARSPPRCPPGSASSRSTVGWRSGRFPVGPGAHDELPGPDDVVLPQLAHRVVERRPCAECAVRAGGVGGGCRSGGDGPENEGRPEGQGDETTVSGHVISHSVVSMTKCDLFYTCTGQHVKSFANISSRYTGST